MRSPFIPSTINAIALPQHHKCDRTFPSTQMRSPFYNIINA
ncbi:hypothetical protein [Nostoc sp.]